MSTGRLAHLSAHAYRDIVDRIADGDGTALAEGLRVDEHTVLSVVYEKQPQRPALR